MIWLQYPNVLWAPIAGPRPHDADPERAFHASAQSGICISHGWHRQQRQSQARGTRLSIGLANCVEAKQAPHVPLASDSERQNRRHAVQSRPRVFIAPGYETREGYPPIAASRR